MNALALNNLNDSGGSPEPVGVTLSASFTFNGTPITINSGSISKGSTTINFALTEPVVLGSVHDFVVWLTQRFGFPDIDSQLTDLQASIAGNPVLQSLSSAFNSFYNGIITITVLSIYRTSSSYRFQLAVSLALNPPIEFFDFVSFDSIGISVLKAGTSGSPNS